MERFLFYGAHCFFAGKDDKDADKDGCNSNIYFIIVLLSSVILRCRSLVDSVFDY